MPNRLLCTVFSILALVAAVVASSIWVKQHREYRGLTNQSHNNLARLSALVQLRPALQQQLNSLDARLSATGWFLRAAPPEIAAAALVERIERHLSGQSARLLEVKFLPSLKEENIVRVAVRARIQGDETALLKLLYYNEQQRPLLFVKNLTVRNLISSQRGLSSQSAPRLDINFDLIGYMLQ